MNLRLRSVCHLILFFAALSAAGLAQDNTPPPPPAAQTATPQASAQPEAQQPPTPLASASTESVVQQAWAMLTDASTPGKPPHDRIDALNALGTMGSDERAAKLIADAFDAKDVDIRTAAVVAAGQTKNPALIPNLRRALDDDEPQVAYNAALVLWRLHDDSGEDLLIAVADGDRRPNASLIKGSKHRAANDLRSPKKLAEITIEAGAGFAFTGGGAGVKAVEYAGKSGSAKLRAAAIDQLAEQHTDEVQTALVEALTDDEPAVRAAAVKGLGRWPGPETARQIEPLFGDNKVAVRLVAAAAYLRATQNIPTPPDCRCEEVH
jgi:HEAT repeat protein